MAAKKTTHKNLDLVKQTFDMTESACAVIEEIVKSTSHGESKQLRLLLSVWATTSLRIQVAGLTLRSMRRES